MNKKTFYITTPIYYPSGELHIGHVYTTTLAWTLRNYKKLNGFDAKFLTGADEHGQKIEYKAIENNLQPQEYVDKMSDKFKNLWKKIEIDFDFYSRTTNKNHKEAVQKEFSYLLKNDWIYKGNYKGLYSVQDEEFITLSSAIKKDDDYYHPTSGHKLEKRDEESYFFKMNKLQKWLEKYIDENPNFIIPKKNVHELKKNFLSQGIQDLSISRSNSKWGIPVLEDPKHVMYVWMDALNNYVTALGYNSDDDSNYQKYWANGDEIVHVVGKEIARFHCIYWPIILKSLGLKQPSTILAHGWIVTPEGKMSKSKGNVINPIELVEKYGPESVKYFFASQINIGQDGVFDESTFINIINSDLANNFGNLLSRTISMIKQNFNGSVKFTKTNNDEDKQILSDIIKAKDEYIKLFDQYEINKALNVATKLSKKLNGYVDITMPWKLKEDKNRLEVVLNILLNGLFAVTTMLSVVIPKMTKLAIAQLNIKELSLDEISNFNKFDNIVVIKQEPIFLRLK